MHLFIAAREHLSEWTGVAVQRTVCADKLVCRGLFQHAAFFYPMRPLPPSPPSSPFFSFCQFLHLLFCLFIFLAPHSHRRAPSDTSPSSCKSPLLRVRHPKWPPLPLSPLQRPLRTRRPSALRSSSAAWRYPPRRSPQPLRCRRWRSSPGEAMAVKPPAVRRNQKHYPKLLPFLPRYPFLPLPPLRPLPLPLLVGVEPLPP